MTYEYGDSSNPGTSEDCVGPANAGEQVQLIDGPDGSIIRVDSRGRIVRFTNGVKS